MKCPSCSRENRARAGFCAWCGASLPSSGEGVTASQPVTSSAEPLVPTAADLGAPPSVAVAPAAAAAAARSAAPVAAEPTASSPPVQPAEGGPLPPGRVLAERYEIVALLESGPGRNVYRARDLRRCVGCASEENEPGTEFCAACGSALDKPAYATIIEQVQRSPEEYDLRFVAQDHEYYVRAEAVEEVPAAAAGSPDSERWPLRLLWGRATDKGLKRDCNEDYAEAWLYARGSGGLLGLFVVADGVGGQEAGDVASRLTTDALWEAICDSVWQPAVRGQQMSADDIEAKLTAAIGAANKAVYDARTAHDSNMSSTLTVALVVSEAAYIGNVGDSRTYLWNSQGLRQITTDHSLVQRLVDTGQITAAEVYVHPQRNLIYNSMGDRPEVKADMFRHLLAPDDRLVLCSDGLWEMVRNEGIEEVLLSEADPQRACDRLVRDANLAGGDDNITVIIVQATALGPARPATAPSVE